MVDWSKAPPPEGKIIERKPLHEELFWHLINYFDPDGQMAIDDIVSDIPRTPERVKNLDEGRWSLSDVMFQQALEEERGNILNDKRKMRPASPPIPGPQTRKKF